MKHEIIDGVHNKKIDDAELTRLWNTGMRADELAERFGCSKRAVNWGVHRLRLTTRGDKKQTVLERDGRVQEFQRALSEGKSIIELQAIFGGSANSIRKWTKQFGTGHWFDRPAQKRVTQDEIKSIWDMWRANVPPVQIGAALGVSYNTVMRHIDRMPHQPSDPKIMTISKDEALKLPRIVSKKPMRVRQSPQAQDITPPPSSPRWTVEMDVEILKTGGKYADLSAVAARYGRREAECRARWLAIR